MKKERGVVLMAALALFLVAISLIFLLITFNETGNSRITSGGIAITGAVIGLTNTTASPAVWKTLFNDSFDRNDSTILGRSWLELSDDGENELDEDEQQQQQQDGEIETDGPEAESNQDVKIENHRLVFDSKNKKNRPVALSSFSGKSYGLLNLSLIFNFERSGNDQDYEFWIQLGNNATMVDPKIGQNQGVAISLKWGGSKNGFASESSLGYVAGNDTIALASINGKNVTIQAIISLENRTFNLSLNGTVVGTSLLFDNHAIFGDSVTIDALRFYTHKLKEEDFTLREIDDLSITHSESLAPQLIPVSPLSAWLTLSPASYNVSTVLEVAADITDDSLIQEVKATIDYPNGTSEVVILSLTNNSKYTLTNNGRYNASVIVPNLQGAYTVNFMAVDEYQNINSTEARTFLVNSTDSDHDGIADEIDALLGDWRNITASGISKLNVTIDGQEANGSYSGIKEVLFFAGQDVTGQKLLVNLSHNFSANGLDFSKINISASGDHLLIGLGQQLTGTKTIWITDNNFVNLCVKDAELSSISEISSGCNAANETDLTSCLGNFTGITLNNITCYDEGKSIKITNLKHSGVKGIIGTTASQPSPGGSDSSGSSSSRNKNALAEKAVLAEPLATANPINPSTQNPPTPPDLPQKEEEQNLPGSSESGNEVNPQLTGAAVSLFQEKSLTPYVLDAVMIVAIMIIVLVTVYYTGHYLKNNGKGQRRR